VQQSRLDCTTFHVAILPRQNQEGGLSFFSKFLGGSAKTPEELADIPSVNGALAALRSERAGLLAERQEITKRRQAAIAADESDAALKRLDSQFDTTFLGEERCDALEARLLDRLKVLQGEERAALLESLIAVLRQREHALDAALAACVETLGDYFEVTRQIEAAGFEQQARSLIIPPPLTANGVVASAESLELWRRQREHVLAVIALASAPRPARKPAAPPVPRAPERAKLQDPAYRPAPTRAARKVEEAPSFGFWKVTVLRNGLEVGGNAHVVGDEIILAAAEAERLARTGAVDIVERGEVGRAAE
jgi:hypothetical protein